MALSDTTDLASTASRVERRTDWGPALEVLSGGRGEPVLFLHDYEYLNEWQPFQERLAADFAVVSPSHPGFGASELPSDLDSIEDLAYLYLDLLRDIGPAHVIGAGIGGWIAAEMAVRSTREIMRLVLVDAVGIKVGNATDRDIADTFILNPKQFLALAWHDPDAGEATMKLPGVGGLSQEETATLLRNRQSAALLTWKPFMHNPKLRSRLHRIDVPSLLLWGESDAIVTPDYGRAFAREIPGAKFATIAAAGHYPYLERPDDFTTAVKMFLQA